MSARAARIDLRTLLTLVLCAGSVAAGLAHNAIDIVGDYALAHDSYDNVAHGSRELVTALGFFVAVLLTARALRACFQIAAANRTRILAPAPRRGEWMGVRRGEMLAKPDESRAKVTAEVEKPVGCSRIANHGDFNAFLSSQPLERFGLGVEVKVVAARVTYVDGKLTRLQVSAEE